MLNLVSGVFGKGMGYWLKDFGADLHEIEVPYDQAVDPGEVERYLDEHPETELLTVVHSETPSGTFNDCARIGPIARAHGVLTLVDCVSSLGGMPLDVDGWQLDVAIAGPRKCLGGPPGMSLMSVSEQAGRPSSRIRPRCGPRSFPCLTGGRSGTPRDSSRTRRRSRTCTAWPRIGHMGPTASGLHSVVGLTALGRSLADLGADVHIGPGVEAALAVISEAAR